MKGLSKIEQLSPAATALICLGVVGIVGIIDYLSGPEVIFFGLYLLAVTLATWRLGKAAGAIISCLSVAAWLTGDIISDFYQGPLIPAWNAVILLVVYLVVVWLLDGLHALQRELGAKVRERTQALTQEMAERERLEKEILEIGENERRRIGQDIHDALCQHLTATALAGQVVNQKLAKKSAPEAAEVRRVVVLIEEGINMARLLARGLQPVQVDAQGLSDAFHNLAVMTSQASNVECAFECETPVFLENSITATNLYRIGQEAVTNALRHAKPTRISVTLSRRAHDTTLTVEDDGIGLPENWNKGRGQGLRIMAHRAAIIGATLSVEPNPTGGTMVACFLPDTHES